MSQQQQPSPIQVLTYVRQVQFPTNRAELIRAAKRRNAPDTVIKTIANLPKQFFNRAGDVADAMKQTP